MKISCNIIKADEFIGQFWEISEQKKYRNKSQKNENKMYYY